MPRPITLEGKTPFGVLICNYLTEVGKNQKSLAQESGLSQFYVSSILSGKSIPSVQTIYSISKATGISMEKLTSALLDKS